MFGDPPSIMLIAIRQSSLQSTISPRHLATAGAQLALYRRHHGHQSAKYPVSVSIIYCLYVTDAACRTDAVDIGRSSIGCGS